MRYVRSRASFLISALFFYYKKFDPNFDHARLCQSPHHLQFTLTTSSSKIGVCFQIDSKSQLSLGIYYAFYSISPG